MTIPTPPALQTSMLTCNSCQREVSVSTLVVHRTLIALIFACECGTIQIMGLAPTSAIAGVDQGPGLPTIPVLVLTDTTQKIALPKGTYPAIKRRNAVD